MQQRGESGKALWGHVLINKTYVIAFLPLGSLFMINMVWRTEDVFLFPVFTMIGKSLYNNKLLKKINVKRRHVRKCIITFKILRAKPQTERSHC